MKIDGYGFYFEEQGRSGEQGPIDPSQQYFEGSHASDAVVRETGQNSLDNRGTRAQGPVKMVFELATVRTDEIPGMEELRERWNAVMRQTTGQQGHDRMVDAAELTAQNNLQVLRISDYNTTGLTGSESLKTPDSALSRLTRGSGSSTDDERGGSFGIGSAVGPMASRLRTVIYTSLPEDGRESVMAGYVRLATHALGTKRYRADGYFTRLDNTDFCYLRPAPPIATFPQRTEPGTDIYILGYRWAEEDLMLHKVRDALIDNFMVAIDRGRLVAEGHTSEGSWTLDRNSLEQYAAKRPDFHAMLLALRDDEPAVKDLPRVGGVKLYMNIDDQLEKKLHTITMRAPLMKIDTFRHNSIAAKYAAILICDDEEGNRYLRRLEPPQHHKWDPAMEPEHGKSVLNSLKKFVRDALRERISERVGDEMSIEGLARYLPTEIVDEGASGNPAAPSGGSESAEKTGESSSVSGDPAKSEPTVQKPTDKVAAKTRRPADEHEGGQETERGKKPGGKKKRSRKGGSLEGEGTEGEGFSRIRGQDLGFRSWYKKSVDSRTSIIALAITPDSDESGDLELAALGPGGDPENSFTLPISRAVMLRPSGTVELDYSGNLLKGLKLLGGKINRIDIHVPSGERYRLGVI